MRRILLLGMVMGVIVSFVTGSVMAVCPTDNSLVVKVTPSVLNTSSQGNYVKAHLQLPEGSQTTLSALLASFAEKPLRIVCVGGNELASPVEMIPGTAEISEDGDVLTVAFYRENLISAIKTLSLTGSVNITVAQEGAAVSGVPIGNISLVIGSSTIIGSFTAGQLTGITTLNLGTPSPGAEYSISFEIVSEGGTCGSTLFSGTADDPLSIDITGGLDDAYQNLSGSCPSLTEDTTIILVIEAYGSGGTLSLSGASLTGPGGGVPTPGLNGTDTIRVK